MIRRIDLRGASDPDYRTLVPRADFDVEAALDVVRPICDAVRHRGVEAILELSAKFDRVDQDDIVVPASALHAALVLSAITSRIGFGLGGTRPGHEEVLLPDLLALEGSVWRTPGYQDLVRRAWGAIAGDRPLRVDFAHERSYDASLPGPLYLAVLHG